MANTTFDEGTSAERREILRLIAFYLPQFHPIPENNEWWGQGFTEWSNVCSSRPRFRGHNQPQLPADLGYYDLRLPEAREAQADLAREYGIHGFCYYHYWFNGRRILERPFQEVLETGEPDFPFCLCWANENWTRRWDGAADQILLQQCYSDDDDLNHVRSLAPAFADPRYIRVGGKPLFLVYRASQLKDARRTCELWREEVNRLGIGDLFLVRVECGRTERGDPTQLGFDAALEFQPNYYRHWSPPKVSPPKWTRWIPYKSEFQSACCRNDVYDYRKLVQDSLCRQQPNYPMVRSVCPGWDNSPRVQRAVIFLNSSPSEYGRWLSDIIRTGSSAEYGNIVFVNAWNEWAEGNHLEPCRKWGRDFLEATQAAIMQAAPHSIVQPRNTP